MRFTNKFSLIATALISAALAQAQDYFRIENGEMAASTLAFGNPTAEIIMEPVNDIQGDALWDIVREGDPTRVSFLNIQSDRNVSAFVEDPNSEVIVSIYNGTIWHIELSEGSEDEYIIKDPVYDLAWTNVARDGGRDNAIFLREQSGSPDQIFKFVSTSK